MGLLEIKKWNLYYFIFRFLSFLTLCSSFAGTLVCRENLSVLTSAAAAAKSLQSCRTPCDAIDDSHQAPCPWDSPGKNTGVGCHFLLQCMKAKSESEVAQSCLTLSDPMDCSPLGSSIYGNFQAKILQAYVYILLALHLWE